ncbi:hypothetical protein QMY03_09300 [Arthrobacter sp. KFRI-F3372]|uniref:hypothetical protein n=1 Tax=Arthrobacter oryzae TaxID=409290 RepID=UPI00278B251E|nr:hypothetical protein [Arthrobacter oryzae]MDP9989011.1 hypothetical protein [Arthrobacter oryzae]WHP61077.1 hypothetical protein QMY03_09300 [Arthrobacter sp. KFRI-F3372]
MAALSWSSPKVLRRPVPLRSVFVWLLLALLLAGAASYTKGSRYALVPAHGPVQPEGEQAVETKPRAEITASPPDTPPPALQAIRVVHEVGEFVEPKELEKDGSERRRAPRGEPVPVRTGVVDPPSLTQHQPGNGILSSIDPLEPELPALTVVDLSISRT